MLCGVDRQLPVDHVIYHGDMRAMYLCHPPKQVRVETAKHQQGPTDATRNDNKNEQERNLTTAETCAGSTSGVKTQK